MKKLSYFSVLAFVVAALFVGMSGVVSAESRDGSGPQAMIQNTIGGMKIEDAGIKGDIDAKTKMELETALKIANTRCASLATEEAKNECVKQNQNAIQMKLDAMIKAKMIGIGGAKGTSQAEEKMIGKKDESSVDGNEKGQVEQKGPEKFAARFSGVVAKLEAYIERFVTLADRIDARAKKLSAVGVDISGAMKFTVAARKELDAAKVSIQAAKDSFKIESANMVGNTDENTNTDAKLVFSIEGFNKCAADAKANGRTLTLTAPQRCTMNGVTYVNADQQFVPGGAVPTQEQGLKKTTEIGNGMFAKTRANILDVQKHLGYALTDLMQANATLTQSEQNHNNDKKTPVTTSEIKATGDVKANTSANTDVKVTN